MKHAIRVQIETSPGQYRYVTAHCESWFEEEMPDNDHRLEMECAIDDAGNYTSVPTGFWRKVEQHMWDTWYNRKPGFVRGDTRHYFPQYDFITLSLDEQHSQWVDASELKMARDEIAALEKRIKELSQLKAP